MRRWRSSDQALLHLFDGRSLRMSCQWKRKSWRVSNNFRCSVRIASQFLRSTGFASTWCLVIRAFASGRSYVRKKLWSNSLGSGQRFGTGIDLGVCFQHLLRNSHVCSIGGAQPRFNVWSTSFGWEGINLWRVWALLRSDSPPGEGSTYEGRVEGQGTVAGLAHDFTCTKHTRNAFPLGEEHLDALHQLKSNKELVITKPDRGTGVVFPDKQDYVAKMMSILNNSTKFERIGSCAKHNNTGTRKRALQEAAQQVYPGSGVLL